MKLIILFTFLCSLIYGQDSIVEFKIKKFKINDNELILKGELNFKKAIYFDKFEYEQLNQSFTEEFTPKSIIYDSINFLGYSEPNLLYKKKGIDSLYSFKFYLGDLFSHYELCDTINNVCRLKPKFQKYNDELFCRCNNDTLCTPSYKSPYLEMNGFFGIPVITFSKVHSKKL